MQRLIECGCEVIPNPFKRKLTKQELLELLTADVRGLIAGLEPLDRDVLKQSSLRAISRCGVGMSNVDLKAAKDLGIAVFNTPSGPTTAVAELTLAVLLALLRRVPQVHMALQKGKWEKYIGTELRGKDVAVIGFGRIGQRVAHLLSAFGARVMGVDPLFSGEIEGVHMVNLERALNRADIITLHCSGENCVIGESELGMTKKGVFLLNAARGGVIDEQALMRALDDGRVAGAWLDSFSSEPYNGPLQNYEQVILTPHMGSYTRECRKQMELEAVTNLIKALERCQQDSNEN